MIDSAIGELETAAAAALDADLTCLDSGAVVELADRLERLRNRLAMLDVAVTAELRDRQLAGDYARATVADLLVTALRITPREAKARARRADELAARRTLQGDELPPQFPDVAEAARAGHLSPMHTDVISWALDHVPTTLSQTAVEVVERTLVNAARHEHPDALRRTAGLLLARLADDDDLPPKDDVERHRCFTLHHYADGSSRATGRLTPAATAALDAVLDTLSAPVSDDSGEQDPRPAPQRRHDAMLDLSLRALRSGTLPPAGGVPVTILVRTTAADLAAGRGPAVTARGDVWRQSDLTSIESDAEIVPIVIDSAGAVLDLGRARRLASRAQRLALTARDGGCSFPGCDRPATWAEVHHVLAWQHGGTTDVDNMCLLCRFHHREFERRGWQVRMRDGVPEWLPPPWLDPDRRPRRNTAHHPPDLDFPELASVVGPAPPAA